MAIPHGVSMPCNSYCDGMSHAVMLLAHSGEDDQITGTDLCTMFASYYAALSYTPIRARRAEMDAQQLYAMFKASTDTPVEVRSYDTHENTCDHTHLPSGFEPWILIVEPLTPLKA
jgi:hypothetical protein